VKRRLRNASASVSASATVVVEKGKCSTSLEKSQTLIKAFEGNATKFEAEEKALTARLKQVTANRRIHPRTHQD